MPMPPFARCIQKRAWEREDDRTIGKGLVERAAGSAPYGAEDRTTALFRRQSGLTQLPENAETICLVADVAVVAEARGAAKGPAP